MSTRHGPIRHGFRLEDAVQHRPDTVGVPGDSPFQPCGVNGEPALGASSHAGKRSPQIQTRGLRQFGSVTAASQSTTSDGSSGFSAAAVGPSGTRAQSWR